jgi:hypothetical protein
MDLRDEKPDADAERERIRKAREKRHKAAKKKAADRPAK